MIRKLSFKQTLLLTILGGLLFAGMQPVYAITHGYLSDDQGLKPGMVVQLSENSDVENPSIERANIDRTNRIIGVSTTIDESSVTIASAEQTVYVETSGEVDAYVSDVNGEIKDGDLLSISPLAGILAKYKEGASSVLALAVEDGAAKPSESYSIQTQQGQKTTKITKIKVNLDQKGLNISPKQNSALEKLGTAITGKQVSELRVIVALIIFIIVLITEGAILYASITSAITSIGRNPLASKQIKRELLKVIGVAFLVLIISLGSIYFVLWV